MDVKVSKGKYINWKVEWEKLANLWWNKVKNYTGRRWWRLRGKKEIIMKEVKSIENINESLEFSRGEVTLMLHDSELTFSHIFNQF